MTFELAPIYEGTNGIQALDLLGRKLDLKNGQLFKTLMAEIKKTITEAKNIELLKVMAGALESITDRLDGSVMLIRKHTKNSAFLNVFANANLFLDLVGDVVMAWMLLWRAILAAQKLENAAIGKDAVFLEGQLKSAEFFIETVLPVTHGRLSAFIKFCGAGH